MNNLIGSEIVNIKFEKFGMSQVIFGKQMLDNIWEYMPTLKQNYI